MFIKATFKDSRKVKTITKYAIKCNLYLYFLIKQRLLIFGEKLRCQQNSWGVSRYLHVFWIIFMCDVTLPNFIIVVYV